MSKKMVVVGGAGFIGSHITDTLVGEGYEVHVIDNLVGGKREHVNEQAVFHKEDIRNLDAIMPIIEGADSVFHLAALPRVQFSIDYPIETNSVNIDGLLNVLVAAQKGGVRRVVYSASSSAYGEQETLPFVETMSPDPLSPYGLQKYVGELYCRVFAKVYSLETVSLRYFNVYGSRFDPEGPYALVIGKFLALKASGKPLTVTGDGTQTRDFTHVRDVVRANILASKSKSVGAGEALNIGAGNNVSILDLAHMISDDIEHVRARLEPHDTLANTTLAKELLGWEPTITLSDGVNELMEEAGLL
jgi:UDP-glucose 4-epimerase